MPKSPSRPATPNRITEISQFPFRRFAPTKTEVIIEGILAKVERIRNRDGLMSVSPAAYVRISFGVPGMRNRIKTSCSSRSGFFSIGRDFSLSSEKKEVTRGYPKRLTR